MLVAAAGSRILRASTARRAAARPMSTMVMASPPAETAVRLPVPVAVRRHHARAAVRRRVGGAQQSLGRVQQVHQLRPGQRYPPIGIDQSRRRA